jgi:hypothetical protein
MKNWNPSFLPLVPSMMPPTDAVASDYVQRADMPPQPTTTVTTASTSDPTARETEDAALVETVTERPIGEALGGRRIVKRRTFATVTAAMLADGSFVIWHRDDADASDGVTLSHATARHVAKWILSIMGG